MRGSGVAGTSSAFVGFEQTVGIDLSFERRPEGRAGLGMPSAGRSPAGPKSGAGCCTRLSLDWVDPRQADVAISRSIGRRNGRNLHEQPSFASSSCRTYTSRHQPSQALRSRLPSPPRTRSRMYRHPAQQSPLPIPENDSQAHTPALAQAPAQPRVPACRTRRNPRGLSLE